MKIKDMKRAAKDNLRGRWFGPFMIGLLFLLICLPALICNMGGTFINEYINTYLALGEIPEELMGMDVEILLGLMSLCSVLGILFYYLFDLHAHVGLARYFLRFGRERAGLGAFLGGFFQKYFRTMWVYFLSGVKILLYTLLFIIPGVLKAIEYSMLPFVMAEHPEMNTREIFEETHTIMKGCKGKYLGLVISFFFWYLLVGITGGLVYPFLLPYYEATLAEFYHYAKDKNH